MEYTISSLNRLVREWLCPMSVKDHAIVVAKVR